ncbi:hypothetical protein [Dyella silvatica]|uniref:hypothetical protein n=1 Tax=Dyella silvatica TaxID=2992128 RepID=UPI002258BBC8|nr:hypothetical protein [Dyella silvatica]
MFKHIFRKKSAPPGHVTATLNARSQPLHRGEIYEDPLSELLREYDLGEINGGGTMQAVNGEVEYCDIEIELKSLSEQNLARIGKLLEQLGAPKGSRLTVESSGQQLPIGLNEGMAVYLNGTDLPDQVYAECDSNVVYSEFDRLLEQAGRVHSYWQGPTETAFYMYGHSFAQMKTLLHDFMASYPLCQRARIEQIA